MPLLADVAEPPPLPLDELLDELLLPHAATPTASTAAIASAIRLRLPLIGGFLLCLKREGRSPMSHGAHRVSPRGFSASNKPSPTRLNARTVSSSATPGKTMYHQAVLKIGVASAIIWPQLAVGGLMPTPRYESAASSRMLVGMRRLA